jgi:SnoaL-like domain
MANANEALLERLYAALNARDGAGAAACYAPDARFSDPVFPVLRRAEPGAMWRMLAERSADLSIELLERSADGERGSSHWRARYTFSQTGRPVVKRRPWELSVRRWLDCRASRQLRLLQMGPAGPRADPTPARLVPADQVGDAPPGARFPG